MPGDGVLLWWRSAYIATEATWEALLRAGGKVLVMLCGVVELEVGCGRAAVEMDGGRRVTGCDDW